MLIWFNSSSKYTAEWQFAFYEYSSNVTTYGMVACVLKCTVLCMFFCYNKSQTVTNRSGEEKDAEGIGHLHCETSTNRILLFHLFEFQTTSNQIPWFWEAIE